MKRLACFDDIAARLQARAVASIATEPKVDAGRWLVQNDVSPIDDSRSVYLSVAANAPFEARFGKTHNPRLYIRCHESTTALLVDFDGAFMADTGGYDQVTLRIDREAAFTKSFDASTDHNALGLWNGAKAIPVIKQMLGGGLLTMRATPYSANPVVIEFPIGGLDEAIKPLRDTCKW